MGSAAGQLHQDIGQTVSINLFKSRPLGETGGAVTSARSGVSGIGNLYKAISTEQSKQVLLIPYQMPLTLPPTR